MASRNASVATPGSGKAPSWSSHLRQFSKTGSTSDRNNMLDQPRSPDTVSSNSNSTIRGRPSSSYRTPRADRRWTVTVNESLTRDDDVLLNLELIGDDVKPGTLMAIEVSRPDAEKPSQSSHHKQHLHDRAKEASGGGAGVPPKTPDGEQRYIFIVKDMPKELRQRYSSVEVYVAKHIADVFGMRKGSQVALTPIEANNPAVEASHIELAFKDQYLSRSDMWRMAVGELSERTVYKGQMILFMGTVKAQVTTVYVDGRKVQSAFFGSNTKPIFRSESARYVLFIQMAREMWDFDSDASGEIIFNKVVNGFLPALFKKWAALKVKHLVSIVLFARVEYDTGISTELANAAIHNDYYTGVQPSGDRRPYKDFYRVVVSEMASGEWTKILYQLKREFNYFRKDISTYHQEAMVSFSAFENQADKEGSLNRIKAEASRAIYGNFLEAINMASSLFAHDYIDRDLMRTGISVVVISPSPGVFEVDYEALRRTTEALVGTGIGIDLICVPKIPLHSVPLFRYRNPQYTEHSQRKAKMNLSRGSTPKPSTPSYGSYSSLSGSYSPSKGTDIRLRGGDSVSSNSAQDEWVYALPSWLHISYWTGASEEALSYHGIAMSVSDTSQVQYGEDFPMRCRMYDLQMRSVMETNEIQTKPLHLDPCFPQKAIQASHMAKPHLDLHGSIFIQNLRVKESLFDHVYGFSKFAPEKNSKYGERSLWKQLQDYDDSRAHLPTVRRGSMHPRHTRNQDDALRRQLLDDTAQLGSSFNERGSSITSQAIPFKHIITTHRSDSGKQDAPSGSRKSVEFHNLNSNLSPSKAPKFMRQISLGNRGFGIAAPKAAVAELSIESVNASRTLAASQNRQGSRVTSTPIKSINRPSSPFKISSGTPLTSQGEFPPLSFAQAHQYFADSPTRPIVIRNQQLLVDLATRNLSGSILSTFRAEPVPNNRDLQNSEAIRAEDAKKVYNSKLLAGVLPELPSTLSPGTGMAPWLTTLNPSNPDTNEVDVTTLYSRWQHVFPKPSEMRVMKWKSLCSPAAVPLTTEYFPSQAQFESDYQRQPYNVSPNADDELMEEPKSRDELLRELISLRFCQGFQIVVGPAVAKGLGQKQLKVADIYSRDHMAEDGTSIFMSVGNTIHQLSCVNGTEVEVNIFVRKPMDTSAQLYDSPTYKPAIRTLLDHGYETKEFDVITPRSERNWNYIDSFIAGHNDELTEHLRFWRARFVLIPVTARHPSLPKNQIGDNEEEIRIEGIRKLAQLWQKHRYVPPGERRFQGTGVRGKKDINPLDIVYKTEDSSVVIAAELETLPLLEGLEGPHRKGQLVRSREQFQKKNLNLAALAEAIQQPVENGGVRMQNRRWHLRLHYNCFIGSDMTSWLLDNIEDLEDRDQAEALGNRLMVNEEDRSKDGEKEPTAKKEPGGLFVHVERRHPFRDGQYFYQITSEYAKPHPPSWFNTKKSQPSIPSTPMTEHMRDSSRPGLSRPTSIHEESSPTSGTTTPTAPYMGGRKPKVLLSKVIKYDVDHRKRSYRQEIVDLHYDRLHNPDNCYHIRVDWMNVTAKLIEDAIENWAREAALYGLRLVEVPIAEACAVTDINPFRRPYLIKPAVPPPNQQPITYYDPNSFAPQTQPGRHFYQKAILKKFDFVLDVEAASNFPSNVDVSYSWGKPGFKYTQYIHRSGVILAEITEEGDFLVLANRLYSNRAATAREKEMQKEMRMEQGSMERERGGSSGGGGGGGGGRIGTMSASYGSSGVSYGGATPESASAGAGASMPSPSVKPAAFLSPLVQPSLGPGVTGGGGGPMHSSSSVNNKNNSGFGMPGQLKTAPGAAGNNNALLLPTSQEPEVIKDELESFCRDGPALDAFYKELLLPERSGSVRFGGGGGPVPAAAVPTMTMTTPTMSFASTATAAAAQGVFVVPDTNIPVLGLPPAVLAAASSSKSPSPRVGSPAMLSASQLLRRGSVQDGILGLRIGSGWGERDRI
ncbi:hypothetical protein B0T17DRAFT_526635 [Bombardia bombarda]|uniref:Vacuolar membrane-associated protein IML1 n=1 Tax=Bombardia bombarda TaxID=252184 RepID=A0AA39X9Z4_9PEZI|nr:hypothetical protein B0T17DRAFT_526635 [Bombardia bombarda]